MVSSNLNGGDMRLLFAGLVLCSSLHLPAPRFFQIDIPSSKLDGATCDLAAVSVGQRFHDATGFPIFRSQCLSATGGSYVIAVKYAAADSVTLKATRFQIVNRSGSLGPFNDIESCYAGLKNDLLVNFKADTGIEAISSYCVDLFKVQFAPVILSFGKATRVLSKIERFSLKEAVFPWQQIRDYLNSSGFPVRMTFTGQWTDSRKATGIFFYRSPRAPVPVNFNDLSDRIPNYQYAAQADCERFRASLEPAFKIALGTKFIAAFCDDMKKLNVWTPTLVTDGYSYFAEVAPVTYATEAQCIADGPTVIDFYEKSLSKHAKAFACHIDKSCLEGHGRRNLDGPFDSWHISCKTMGYVL